MAVITVRPVERAVSAARLDELVQQAAFERGCDLGDLSYSEAIKFFESEAGRPLAVNFSEIISILRAAEVTRAGLDA